MNDDFAKMAAEAMLRPDGMIYVNSQGSPSMAPANPFVPVEKPEPATAPEIVAMTKQLAACEAALTQVMDAMMAIRFGLLCAGYPVDLKDALKHPYVEHLMQAERRVEINEDTLKLFFEKKKIQDSYSAAPERKRSSIFGAALR